MLYNMSNIQFKSYFDNFNEVKLIAILSVMAGCACSPAAFARIFIRQNLLYIFNWPRSTTRHKLESESTGTMISGAWIVMFILFLELYSRMLCTLTK